MTATLFQFRTDLVLPKRVFRTTKTRRGVTNGTVRATAVRAEIMVPAGWINDDGSCK
jgi:hypothetical protein